MTTLQQVSSKKSLDALFSEVKSNLPEKKKVTEIPYKNDPIEFFARYLKILDKKKRLIPFIANAEQRQLLKDRQKKNLYLKPRQVGISTAIQANNFRNCVTRSFATATLAHDMATTQKLRRMTARFYDNMPKQYRPVRSYDNAQLTSFPELDSEIIIATAGSKQAGRGGTYSSIHGSEVAFWKDAESIVAGLMQGGDPEIDLESTPNGAQGYFYEKCQEAKDGNIDWKFHFFPWYDFKEYQLPLIDPDEIVPTPEELELIRLYNLKFEQIKWRRDKISDLKQLFIQEYPEDRDSCFLLSGFGYFGSIENAYIVPDNQAPLGDHVYAAGLDFGQANDYTVLSIVDCTIKKQVALYRWNKLKWSEIRSNVIDQFVAWHVKNCKVESNNMGSTNIEAMKDEIKLRNMESPTRLQEFETSNATKQHIMSNLYEMLHSGEFKLLNHPVLKSEMTTFVSTQLPSGLWRLAASGSAHDDCVMATAFSLDGMINDRWHGGVHI